MRTDMIFYPSPAKINLFLHIISRRDDGYHNLQTAFQFLDLCDDIGFKKRFDNKITLTAPLNIPEQQNLIFQAARLLQNQYDVKQGVDIQLIKKIPMGAGLGGGSSNAATTLLALNSMWKLNLSTNQLMQLGRKLGADVPIFIYGLSSFAQGIGDEFTQTDFLEQYGLLIIPPAQVITAEIYADSELTRNTPLITISEFLRTGGHNDFEYVVCKRYPPVREAISWLKQFAPAKLTGSGSGVFAQFNTQDEALAIFRKMPQNFRGYVARIMNKSPLQAFFGV